MLFVSKLGTMLGPSLPEIFQSGLSLAFQEVGHIIGTIVLGLPIALLIGMKREAIGATFSIDREPNLAIIAEKYGQTHQKAVEHSEFTSAVQSSVRYT